MRAIDGESVTFWHRWWADWSERIQSTGLTTPGDSTTPKQGPRRVRASDVSAAWTRAFMPAVDPEYVMPDWWLTLSREEKRRTRPPGLIMRHRPVKPASERSPGFSLDDVGPYLKLRDGTVCRDRRSAAHRLWRQAGRASGYDQVVAMLPARTGVDGRVVKGRKARRVLDALVCYGLVHAGMTQEDAAQTVLAWADHPERDPKKLADVNRVIWRELHLPAVSA